MRVLKFFTNIIGPSIFMLSCNSVPLHTEIDKLNNDHAILTKKYDGLKFDYQYYLLNQYKLEDAKLNKTFVYDSNGDKVSLYEKLNNLGSPTLLFRIHGSCFSCLSELIDQQIKSIEDNASLLKHFKKIVLIANVDSPRQLKSIIDYPELNFESYFIKGKDVLVDPEEGRRGIYFAKLNKAEGLSISHVYIPMQEEQETTRKYFIQFLEK